MPNEALPLDSLPLNSAPLDPDAVRTLPFSIPLSFFLSAPIGLAVAGMVLIDSGSAVFLSTWVPLTVAFTHLFTLAFIAMSFIGAFYVMCPLLLGSPIPWPRLAHFVHAGFCLGLVGMLWGIARPAGTVVFWSIALIFFALAHHVVPATVLLLRTPIRGASVQGLRLALGCFFLTVFLGLWIAHGYGGMAFPGHRTLWLQVHVTVALFGFVGGTLCAVSWRLLPTLYGGRPVAEGMTRTIQWMLLFGLGVPTVILFVDYLGGGLENARAAELWAGVASLPAGIAIWVLLPIASTASLRGVRSGERFVGLRFWRVGLWLGPLAGVVGAFALWTDDPKHVLLFGWIALWGWAGMLVHGMLLRAVPALSVVRRMGGISQGGFRDALQRALPEGWVDLGLGLHMATLVVGAAVIVADEPIAARALGALLLVTALHLLRSLVYSLVRVSR